MRSKTLFRVRDTAHHEPRGLFFIFGSMRWGAVVGTGDRISLVDAPVAAVESVLRPDAPQDPDIGLGFKYQDPGQLLRWIALNLRGAELVISRPTPKPVVVVPYDPQWAIIFKELSSVCAGALGELAIAIHHGGSTAVPGLAAKPVIDIDVEIPSRAVLPAVIIQLATLGYRHGGDIGVPGREAFERDGAGDVPRDGSGRLWQSHNLYVCASDCVELRRHLLFRDWLRTHPARAAEYGALKHRLAELHRDDRESYIEGKTDLVDLILTEAAAATAPAPRGCRVVAAECSTSTAAEPGILALEREYRWPDTQHGQ